MTKEQKAALAMDAFVTLMEHAATVYASLRQSAELSPEDRAALDKRIEDVPKESWWKVEK